MVVDTNKPNRPEFVEIDSVPPLVTISEVKEVKKVRDDAWVRIKSHSVVDSDELPDRVLKTEYVPHKKDKAKKDRDEEETEDPAQEVISMKELKRYLKKEARLIGKPLKIALRKAEQYIAKVGR